MERGWGALRAGGYKADWMLNLRVGGCWMCWATVLEVFPLMISIKYTGLVGVLDRGNIVLDHLFQHFLHFLSNLKIVPLLIILLTIVPNQLQVVQHFLYCVIFPGFHLLLHLIQVHRVLNNIEIVIQFQLFKILLIKYLSMERDAENQWLQEYRSCC